MQIFTFQPFAQVRSSFSSFSDESDEKNFLTVFRYSYTIYIGILYEKNNT